MINDAMSIFRTTIVSHLCGLVMSLYMFFLGLYEEIFSIYNLLTFTESTLSLRQCYIKMFNQPKSHLI